MDNELKVEGNENVSFQGINNSNITIIINKSTDYKRLLDELSSLEEHLADLNPEKTDKINQLKNKIVNKNTEIERFKQDVISLADAFSRIDINTLRLIKAKEYFYEGKFKEANTILKLTEIDKDQNILLIANLKKEKELEGLSKQLADNSNEYYIKAKAVMINSYLSNSFGEIFDLFKRSIKSHSGFNNNLGLGEFFVRNKKYNLAEPYLLTALRHKESIDPKSVSGLLNSIGVALKEQGKLKEAEKYYIDSIDLQKTFVKEVDYQSVSILAISTMNLGLLYTDLGEFNKDLLLLEEALRLFRKFPEDSNEYFDQLALCLNNIGNHYANPENYDSEKLISCLEEALELRRHIVLSANIPYLVRLADILGNLAQAYCEKNNLETAEILFKEAVAKYEAYESIGIFSHRPSHILLLLNVAVFYTDYSKNKIAALSLANRALQLIQVSNPMEQIKRRDIGRIIRIYNDFDEELPLYENELKA